MNPSERLNAIMNTYRGDEETVKKIHDDLYAAYQVGVDHGKSPAVNCFVELVEALKASADVLEESFSGYISGSRHALQDDKRRDEALMQARAAIKKAEEAVAS